MDLTLIGFDEPAEVRTFEKDDSWVVGDQPYVLLHIMGSEEYAT